MGMKTPYTPVITGRQQAIIGPRGRISTCQATHGDDHATAVTCKLGKHGPRCRLHAQPICIARNDDKAFGLIDVYTSIDEALAHR
jgi:hypothetical protein